MSNILARAMIGVVASASPELSGPQIAWTLTWLINSWVAFTALVGSPWVSRITIPILRPLTPPAALIASAAEYTPRLKPMVGAELGPVIAARQPILIGSDCAIAGFGNESVAALSALALPNKRSRREMRMKASVCLPYRRPSLLRASVLSSWHVSGLKPERPNLNLTGKQCP